MKGEYREVWKFIKGNLIFIGGDVVREFFRGREVEVEMWRVYGNWMECWGTKSVFDRRNSICKSFEDIKYNMLEELKGDECSWCGDCREKERVVLVTYKNKFFWFLFVFKSMVV